MLIEVLVLCEEQLLNSLGSSYNESHSLLAGQSDKSGHKMVLVLPFIVEFFTQLNQRMIFSVDVKLNHGKKAANEGQYTLVNRHSLSFIVPYLLIEDPETRVRNVHDKYCEGEVPQFLYHNLQSKNRVNLAFN